MKSQHFKSTLICIAILGALSVAPVMAQTATPSDTSVSTSTTHHESTRLSTEFTEFAGSDTNSQALVTGLRDGTAITLDDVTTNADGTTTTTATTFTPATGKMGYGNVKIALSLAETRLAQAGIADRRHPGAGRWHQHRSERRAGRARRWRGLGADRQQHGLQAG